MTFTWNRHKVSESVKISWIIWLCTSSCLICLFVFLCLCFYVPFPRDFSLVWRRHKCRWRAAKFYIYSTPMAIEQWEFFSVPHLLWHGTSVYNGHLLGPVTLTPIAECGWQWIFPYLLSRICRGWGSIPDLLHVNTLLLDHRRGLFLKFVHTGISYFEYCRNFYVTTPLRHNII